jgi:hypothetical protein
VLCRSDYTYAQEPLRFAVGGGEQREVSAVLRRWHDPEGAGFRVAAGGRRYELRYLNGEDRWQARRLP